MNCFQTNFVDVLIAEELKNISLNFYCLSHMILFLDITAVWGKMQNDRVRVPEQ